MIAGFSVFNSIFFVFNCNFLYSIKISSTRRPLWALGRPRKRREDQNLSCSTWRIRSRLFWYIKFSNVFFQWISLRFIIYHVCLQGLTGERRYTKSPPKTRSSIFSSKPYNASHYAPSFSSKVSLYLLLFLCQKNVKNALNVATATATSNFLAIARADTWGSRCGQETATRGHPLHCQGF